MSQLRDRGHFGGQRVVEHYGEPDLFYARYPVMPELRCGMCGADKSVPPGQRRPGVAYKNGVPYDCKCNMIEPPFSMPYEVKRCAGCSARGCGRRQYDHQCRNRASMYTDPSFLTHYRH